jgi:acyl-coenzyme A synthetase/AMP-(fatty) acid ligase
MRTPATAPPLRQSEGKIFTKWFDGGTTNICYNALDRHVASGDGDKIAFYHEANDEGEELASWTYAEVPS